MLTLSLAPVRAHSRRSFRPVGATVHDGGVTFRVWAPSHTAVRVATGDGTTTRYVTLEPEADAPGFFSGRDDHGRHGDVYWIQLEHQLAPDPASRFQPRGVDGPSQVVDPASFPWKASGWTRPALRGRVIYELHAGTFTPEGTFLAAAQKLDALVDLGVNTIELMPIGDFPGERGWGYDGVMLFAPARCYGTPHELRALIDAAHARGLAVVIDVVYNHLGPSGNVLPLFSNHYFHARRETLWGTSLNFDEEHSAPVREFFLQNACMWFDEYRVDGLRLDAVHAIADRSTPHLVSELAAAAHERGAFVVAEDDRNDAQIICPPDAGGWGVDGMWSDDFHHTMRVAVTRERHAHFAGYSGAIDEWVETLREGWFYRGQFFSSWKRARGTPCGHIPPERFVVCTSNHDQVGNRPLGERLSMLVTPEVYRAVSMLGCLLPYTPLLFMGQEWGAQTAFPYFSHLPGEIGESMVGHRIKEFRHYGAVYPDDVLARMPDPQAESTFLAAKLDWNEREQPIHRGVLALYRTCLRLRAREPIFQSASRDKWAVEKVGADVVAITWRDAAREWRLLMSVGAASLQAAPAEHWTLVCSSNDPEFGGSEAQRLTGPGATLWQSV
jgi:maltooligosyltrehalose trehalohydrolase